MKKGKRKQKRRTRFIGEKRCVVGGEGKKKEKKRV
jgi:hypothetical protein